ncbi:hypothetical protein [Sporosarcina sp. E16_8]|uniref:hypothetical protein n=1 Tax=Sporosarcina sp. E16_8 TaxID=2789295 RepID=UPI001A9251E9|nr:hypothetical protein [Sporosarcina sp. E16_8]MBO0589374.1 hypothetical protein [Sporosarcina sp. E16_8]
MDSIAIKPWTDNPVNNWTFECSINNIYAVSNKADVLWRVKSLVVDYPRLPYEQMVIHEDGIRATDFYGRRVFISKNTGQILKKDIVK